jgi:arsenate reductase
MSDQRERVLFLCTANSARSQMAEALLRRRAGDRFEVLSAGLAPRQIHPLTLRVLEEIGIGTEGLRPKAIDEFLGKTIIHYAVVVCENAQASCPRLYPFAMQQLYWPFDDPAAFVGNEIARLGKFRAVRDQIDEKIATWLAALPSPSPTPQI